VIAADTSVVVRYLVGAPADQSRRATRLLEGDERVGLPVTVLVETAHVLRTQYGVSRANVIEALLALATRENVEPLGLGKRDVIEAFVAARSASGRPIPDVLVVYAARSARALPLYTFDRGMASYGIAVAEP
jgi:predicted nucleic acid-binding protein